MKSRHFLPVLAAVVTILMLNACFHPFSAKVGAGIPVTRVDYADPANWVLLPEKISEAQAVDVFYIYPSVYSHPEHRLMRWDDPAVVTKTRHISLQQTGPFREFAAVYAPFVRQGEFRTVMRELESRGENTSTTQSGAATETCDDLPAAMLVGAADTRDAFRYYYTHYNRGRPFLLVGHSQGAYDLLELLKHEFYDEALRGKLIAAYLPGWMIPEEVFRQYPHLKPADGALDLGAIVCWNTEAPEAPKALWINRDDLICINPLNWRTDATPAPASDNLGAVFFDGANHMTGEIPGFCGAVIKPGLGVLAVTPAFPGHYDSSLLGPGIYHMNDIYFFYRNLQVNARDRVTNYFHSQAQD